MIRYYEMYDALVREVWRNHQDAGAVGGGHDFPHALMVAQYAQKVAEGERFPEVIARLGWLAGIVHNTDRLYSSLDDQKMRDLIIKTLSDFTGGLSAERISIVADAVLVHSLWELPKNFGGHRRKVAVLLRDADKLASINGLLPLRSAQNYHNLPVYDVVWGLDDPEATYRNPKTVARDIQYSLEWQQPGWIVTETARKLAEPGFKALEGILADMERPFRETGLNPWPLPYH